MTRNEPEECCHRPPEARNPYCIQIDIPHDDPFYGVYGVRCIDFVRGFPGVRAGCRLGMQALMSFFNFTDFDNDDGDWGIMIIHMTVTLRFTITTSLLINLHSNVRKNTMKK